MAKAPNIDLGSLAFDTSQIDPTLAKTYAKIGSWLGNVQSKLKNLEPQFDESKLRAQEQRLIDWGKRVSGKLGEVMARPVAVASGITIEAAIPGSNAGTIARIQAAEASRVARMQADRDSAMHARMAGSFGGMGSDTSEIDAAVARSRRFLPKPQELQEHERRFRGIAQSIHTVDSALAVVGVDAGAFTTSMRGVLIGVEHVTYAASAMGIGLKGALIGTGIGAAVVALGAGISHFASVMGEADKTARKFGEGLQASRDKARAFHAEVLAYANKTDIMTATVGGRTTAVAMGGIASEQLEIRKQREAFIRTQQEAQGRITEAGQILGSSTHLSGRWGWISKIGLTGGVSAEAKQQAAADLAKNRGIASDASMGIADTKRQELATWQKGNVVLWNAGKEAVLGFARSAVNGLSEVRSEVVTLARDVGGVLAEGWKIAGRESEDAVRKFEEQQETIRREFVDRMGREEKVRDLEKRRDDLLERMKDGAESGTTIGSRRVSSFNRSLFTSGAGVAEGGTLRSIDSTNKAMLRELADIKREIQMNGGVMN